MKASQFLMGRHCSDSSADREKGKLLSSFLFRLKRLALYPKKVTIGNPWFGYRAILGKEQMRRSYTLQEESMDSLRYDSRLNSELFLS